VNVRFRSVRRLARTVAAFLVALIGAVAIVLVVLGLWSRTELDAVVVFSITQRVPVVAPLVRLLTDAPRRQETHVGGQPTTLVRPAEGRGPWPAIVFVNGATRAGRFHPEVQRLAQGLARAGFLVAVPDLPGLRLGQITPATTQALIRVARSVARRPDVRSGRVSFYGVSVGATLALLAAEAPALTGRVRAVGGEAPWASLAKVVRLATTGRYGAVPYRTDPYLSLAIARSLAAGLPPGGDRTRLLRLLGAVPDGDPRPLAPLRRIQSLHAGGRALVALLLNRDPRRYRALYARLPGHVRCGIAMLSPLRRASHLRMPVELASAPHDKYFPPAESRSLARRSPRVRVTITSTLVHAVPEPSSHAVRALLAFDRFVVRFLDDATAR
jgi:pimeloyl-ACP methyl ester carboxylesterase